MNTLLKLGFRRKHRPSVLDLFRPLGPPPKSLRPFRPGVDYPLHDHRTPATLNNLQLQRSHDLGLYDEPVVQTGPDWVQLAHPDIERYFGKGPMKDEMASR
jgi:hypothetical protein